MTTIICKDHAQWRTVCRFLARHHHSRSRFTSAGYIFQDAKGSNTRRRSIFVSYQREEELSAYHKLYSLHSSDTPTLLALCKELLLTTEKL